MVRFVFYFGNKDPLYKFSILKIPNEFMHKFKFYATNSFYSNLETLEKAIISEICIAFHKFYNFYCFKLTLDQIPLHL